ncbi:hypothetical protein [Streptomyces buecherae]|uniref:Uncharacterized protein n=1 Tax=Streptomyces buecherae TaxID=2763006 RepID=A0A7H8N7E9_9ACTN|nr:hypothetical protein [Streptomyces buecherae]QKW50407.1 hypothetical protein HUT08_13665 [Streptomyces buecherae]
MPHAVVFDEIRAPAQDGPLTPIVLALPTPGGADGRAGERDDAPTDQPPTGPTTVPTAAPTDTN